MNPLDRPIAVTLFPSFGAQQKREARWTPRQLAREVATATAERKGDLPWLKLARFGDKRTEKRSLRHDANVLAITGVEADYDAGQLSVDHACERLEQQGVAAIVYTSPSHTEDGPRWRVLCPLSAEMPPERRAHQLGRLNGLFRGAFAAESFTLSQAYYYGSVRGNPSHRVELIDGWPIDQHDDLDETWLGRPGGKQADTSGPIASGDAREDSELVRQIVMGTGYHVEMCALAARYVGRGMSAEATAGALRGLMLAHPPETRDERWADRFASIDELVASAANKYAPAVDHRRELARIAGRLIHARVRAAEVRERIRAEAQARGVDPMRGVAIADWVAQRELERRRGRDA